MVSDGSTIIRLESDNVTDSVQSASDNVKDAQISLENQYENLEDYTVKSPINGTVIEKLVKAGDTIDAGAKLCTIYDLSYLKMTMNVDCLLYTSGLDMTAAKEAFAEFLDDTNLDSRQIYFVNQIVEFIVHNGMMKDLSAVSYTHLDVYKRQERRGVRQKNLSLSKIKEFEVPFAPVSYTHLY